MDRIVYYLFVIGGGESAKRQIVLKDGEHLLGRAKSVNVHLDDQKASGKHCRIVVSGNKLLITDLKSSNGTYVNGSKIEEVEIRVGDRIVIGTTVFELRKGKA